MHKASEKRKPNNNSNNKSGELADIIFLLLVSIYRCGCDSFLYYLGYATILLLFVFAILCKIRYKLFGLNKSTEKNEYENKKQFHRINT